MSKLKRFFEEMTKEKAPGPSPTFTLFHLLHALELIAEKPIGRSKLAENLNVGEGTARTIIERMRNADLVTISKAGCALTPKGVRLWKEYKSVFQKRIEIEKSELAFADYNFAMLIKNRGNKVKSGVEQRDAAVMAGAKGATTMVFKEGRLTIPSVSGDVLKDFPRVANQIVRLLDPKANDVIIIGSAKSSTEAIYGTLAAAWTLLDDC